MYKKLKKLGFISIELVAVAGIVLSLGLSAVSGFTKQGKEATNREEDAMSEAMNAADEFGEKIKVKGDLGGFNLLTQDVEKGDLIKIEGKQYRVLSIDRTKAKVLAMSDATSIKFNDSSITTSFDGTNGQKYAGSKLDNYLENTWFTGLSQDMKDAIVAQDITQNMFKWQTTPAVSLSWYKPNFAEADTSGTNYTLSKAGSVSVGSRHVYALDVQDVIDYFGSSFQPQDFNEMFFNQRSAINKNIWLRSSNTGIADGAFLVHGSFGFVDYGSNCTVAFAVRPAFVIDLSKIEFEK